MAKSWPTCDQEGCGGVCLASGTSCLVHAEDNERDAALAQLSETGSIDVRGVVISERLGMKILETAPHDEHGHHMFEDALFDGVTFTGDAWFDGATFNGDARFDEATFNGLAYFDEATFRGGARFDEVTFKADVKFDGATFNHRAGFVRATFNGSAQFGDELYHATHGAKFDGTADFGGAIFNGSAHFAGVAFNDRAWFAKATFNSDAWFTEVTFQGDAGFVETTFKRLAHLYKVRFNRIANFRRATFEEDAPFDQARFSAYADFDGAAFEGDAGFGGVTFNHGAGFDGAKFNGRAHFMRVVLNGSAGFAQVLFKDYADFSGARFEGNTRFDGAAFGHGAQFDEVAFEGYAGFNWTMFAGDAKFADVTFKGDTSVLGPVVVERLFDLDRAQFVSPVRIEADAGVLSCRRGRFPGGVRFGLSRAVVWLDDSDLSVPSLLAGLSFRPAEGSFAPGSYSLMADLDAGFRSLEKFLIETGTVRGPAEIIERPRLLSLQRANVAGLTLVNVDLANCRFGGAYNLDKLRLEAGTDFGLSPAAAGWERRQVIAEESAWRAARVRPGRWITPPSFDPDDPLQIVSPGAIAVLYRALRKSREDAKDEPGAADFYYGEMEMRRHSDGGSRGRATRYVLFAYWLISGYGLRAWRSLAALAVVTAAFAVAFHLWGFTTPPEPASYWTSLLFAFRSTISLTDNGVTLTAWGSLLQALLRVTGPVLLGLMLLALRNRVKR
jgi:hypothetical protein